MTKFSGTPLFGKDSSPHNTSKILGFIGTCVIWLILLICFAIINPVRKPEKYKEIQIVLESTPEKKEEVIQQELSPKNVEQQSASSDTSNPDVVKPEKNVAKKVFESESKTPAKATAKTKQNVSNQTVNNVEDDWDFEYAVDPMEAFAQQTAQAPKKEVNWDEMFSDNATTETSSSSGGVIKGGNSFSGTAGVASQNSVSGVKSSQVGDYEDDYKASGATSDFLGAIANATFTGTAGSGGEVSSKTNVKASRAGDGKVYIKMTSGRARALLKPASPAINLSDRAADLIDGSRTVKIRFVVLQNGNVPFSKITITPGAILPDLVQQEIKDQISKWIFEPDSFNAEAEFEYNIVKK